MVTNATWKYHFLPLTVCAINPLVTTSLVNYSSGVINTSVIRSRPLGSDNTKLTQFLAAIVDYQSRTTQGLTTNTIGDALYSIYVSTSGNNSSSTHNVTNLLLCEMVSFPRPICCPQPSEQALLQEQYWRGVIEFSGTVRLFYSIQPNWTNLIHAPVPSIRIFGAPA